MTRLLWLHVVGCIACHHSPDEACERPGRCGDRDLPGDGGDASASGGDLGDAAARGDELEPGDQNAGDLEHGDQVSGDYSSGGDTLAGDPTPCLRQCGRYDECGDDGCGGHCGTCPSLAPDCIDMQCEGSTDLLAAVCGPLPDLAAHTDYTQQTECPCVDFDTMTDPSALDCLMCGIYHCAPIRGGFRRHGHGSTYVTIDGTSEDYCRFRYQGDSFFNGAAYYATGPVPLIPSVSMYTAAIYIDVLSSMTMYVYCNLDACACLPDPDDFEKSCYSWPPHWCGW